MREIIFKAKRVDSGEWVEGSLVRFKYTHHDIVSIMEIEGLKFEVDPETVCQYTGLKDKNGNKIFEGDTTKAGDLECVIKYWMSEFVAEWKDERGNTRNPSLVFRQHEITGNIHD